MMNSWITQLRKGLIEYCVMKRLVRGESYGYEIVQRLKGMNGLVITESIVYPILGRLLKEGCVKVKAIKSQDGPPRRYYDLTVTGERRFEEMDVYWRNLCKSVEQLN